MSLISSLTQIQSGDADTPTRDMSNWNAIRDVVNGQLGDVNFGSSDPLNITKITPYTAWVAHTTTLVGSTTNPTLGTGGTIVARYSKIGKTVTYTGKVTFGSGGTNAGSGTYSVDLPVDADLTVPYIGSMYTLGGAGPTAYSGICIIASADALNFYISAQNLPFAHNIPHAWDANDTLYWTITYEAAS